MRRHINKSPAIIVLLVFVAVASFLVFAPRTANADSVDDRIHFIKNESNSADAIVVESNGHFGLVDTMSPSPSSAFASINPSQTDPNDNGTKVANYLNSIGCNKLDFIIITHNHSGHIGGISELTSFIDSHTIVFYKESQVEEIAQNNFDYYAGMLYLIRDQNAIECATSKKCGASASGAMAVGNSFIGSLTIDADSAVHESWMEYNISLAFGDFDIKLYNILDNNAGLASRTESKEDRNSIVAYIEHRDSNTKTALLGDALYYAMRPVDDIIGPVDIMKASSHGDGLLNPTSLLDKLSPETYIITATHATDPETGEAYPQDDHVVGNLYLKKHGGDTYYTSQSDGAIVASFTSNNYEIKNYNAGAGEYKNAPSLIENVITPRWYSYGGERYYVRSNSLLDEKGLIKINGEYYHLDSDSKMITGMSATISGDKIISFSVFRTRDDEIKPGPMGAAITGFAELEGNLYYFRTEENDVTAGPAASWVLGLVEIEGEYYYFRTDKNDITEGAQGSAIRNECVTIEDQGRCFGEDGAQTSVYAPAQKPTIAKTDYVYTGASLQPAINGFDSNAMARSGTVNASNIGEYTITIKLKNKTTTRWSDGSTSDIEFKWRVTVPNPAYRIKNYTANESEKTISKIAANTTANIFKSNITLSAGISAEVDTHSTTKNVYTGSKTRIKAGSTTLKEFTNIITGDPSGDGQINSADLLSIRKHLLGTSLLKGAYFKAANVNTNGASANAIMSDDLLRIRQHLLGSKPIN